MFQKGDLIVYGSTGVCRVEDIGPLKGIEGTGKKKDYYTLVPVFSSGIIYIPTNTEIFMRPVLTKEQADALIDRIPSLEDNTMDLSSPRQLSELYHAAFESHQCEDLLKLIHTLYLKSQKTLVQGRRVGLTETNYRKHAEELLHGEFSVALGIPYEAVSDYIVCRLNSLSAHESSRRLPIK